MRLIWILALLVVLGTLSIGLVAAHGNEVAVDDQVSSDGTLTIAHVSYLEDAYLVAREATGDGPGEPVGYRHLAVGASAIGERDVVDLSLNDSYWNGFDGNTSLWVVLHHDDGENGFSVTQDELLTQSNETVGQRISVARGDGNVSVVASDQETNDTVTVNRVALAESGYLVLHASGESDPIVGQTALDAGVHENVSVTVDGSHYNRATDSFSLSAVVYRDDGDAAFDDEDAPVRAGDAPVASGFEVTKAVSTVDVTPTNPQTATPVATVTATMTTTPPSTQTTATAGGQTTTPASAESTAGQTTASQSVTSETAGAGETTSGSGPGFGVVATLAALLLGSGVGSHRVR